MGGPADPAIAGSVVAGMGIVDWFRKLGTSKARLQSLGFVQQITGVIVATGELRTQPFGLLPDGKRFYERIQKIPGQ